MVGEERYKVQRVDHIIFLHGLSPVFLSLLDDFLSKKGKKLMPFS
jgi:hypothetical protein